MIKDISLFYSFLLMLALLLIKAKSENIVPESIVSFLHQLYWPVGGEEPEKLILWAINNVTQQRFWPGHNE